MPATDLTPPEARIPPSQRHGNAWPASSTAAGTPGNLPRRQQKHRGLALGLVSVAVLLPLSGSLATPISAPHVTTATATISQDTPMAAAPAATDLLSPPLTSSSIATTEARESAAAAAIKPRPGNPPALIDSAPGLLQVVLSLGLIVGLLLLTLWLLKRLTNPQGRAGPSGALARVISATAIGQRERVVIVEVADTWLVLGVGAGQISKLHELPRQNTAAAPADPVTMHDFANRLKQLLGQRHVS